jgi:broad specificity phosphatase PhoE
MAKLLLIKHSLPEIEEGVPSQRWELSDEGRRRCLWLCDEISAHKVERLYCSLEPKAFETAGFISGQLGIVASGRPQFRENDRTGLGFLPAGELKARIKQFFDEPSRVVIGKESAEAARKRFVDAVKKAVVSANERNAAIVAHGTVITLLVAAHNKSLKPMELWGALKTPGYVVVDSETFVMDGVVRNHPDA